MTREDYDEIVKIEKQIVELREIIGYLSDGNNMIRIVNNSPTTPNKTMPWYLNRSIINTVEEEISDLVRRRDEIKSKDEEETTSIYVDGKKMATIVNGQVISEIKYDPKEEINKLKNEFDDVYRDIDDFDERINKIETTIIVWVYFIAIAVICLFFAIIKK